MVGVGSGPYHHRDKATGMHMEFWRAPTVLQYECPHSVSWSLEGLTPEGVLGSAEGCWEPHIARYSYQAGRDCKADPAGTGGGMLRDSYTST